MTPTVQELRRAGMLSALDAQLALTLAALDRASSPQVVLATAIASRETKRGNVCADLGSLASARITSDSGQARADWHYPELSEWVSALRASSLVTRGTPIAPLVLDDKGRLYLRRFWDYEQRLADLLARRAATRSALPRSAHAPLRAAIERLFGPASEGEVDWQRVSAMVATLRPLSVVTGGPGTGKTSTVVRILALLLEVLREGLGRQPRPLLLAPTGKAAARLAAAVESARARLDCSEEIRRQIPTQASTIHRALGPLPGTLTRFRHNATDPMIADVVVVDEASMIDVAMMSRLVSAIPPSARLILLGDADQLASVEAGAVLSDLAGGDAARQLGTALGGELHDVFGYRVPAAEDRSDRTTPLAGSIVQLSRSYRFGDDTGLGQLAAAIRAGDADRALALLQSNADLGWNAEPSPGPALRNFILRGFRGVPTASTVEDAMDQLERFRILCAHRQGPTGVDALNSLAEGTLREAARARPAQGWLRGRPILVTQNDYKLRLFNGDIGLIWPDPTGTLRAYFRDADDLRAIGLSRLPNHETAFCMSVHKSQGSEFDEVIVVLPDPASPLLSRELLYTAVTRARKTCRIFGTEAALRVAVDTRVRRNTGLRDAIASIQRQRSP